MLDFLPYFLIVIGLYISFCFEKLIQQLLWSEDFTKGLTRFYQEWSTLAWHKKTDQGEPFLQKSIEQSIKGYVARTKKLGLFMLISVSTMLLSYCWVGHCMTHNDQLMMAYSLWNLCFFILVFYRKVWSNWWYVISLYVILLCLTSIAMFILSTNKVGISHSIKIALAIESVLGMTFPLIVELFRTRVRSDFFLGYLTSCRDKFSKRSSLLLQSLVTDEYKKSKYLLQLQVSNFSTLKDGDTFDKGQFIDTLMTTILEASEKQALKIFTEDNRTFKILIYNKFSQYYKPVDLEKLNSEEDLFKLHFSFKRKSEF